MADARFLALIDDLRCLPAETTWVEFKENNVNPNVSRNAAQISQVIRRALDDRLILAADPARPRSGYLPFWA